ncbi:unnamed protein product [Vicia faba]|uniref:Uncharacterized protein n=1 Tax=Vicia faba TaxID=3906 RepID=A0AAV0Z3J0_VICFA|nr:unnamed protein product [Vicia faba]
MIEEVYWKEKAYVQWHTNGDRNTKFFHRMAKIRNTTQSLHSLKIGNNIVTKKEDIVDHVVQHYSDLFNTVSILQDSNLVEQVIPSLVSEQNNKILTMIPLEDEISIVVFWSYFFPDFLECYQRGRH